MTREMHIQAIVKARNAMALSGLKDAKGKFLKPMSKRKIKEYTDKVKGYTTEEFLEHIRICKLNHYYLRALKD